MVLGMYLTHVAANTHSLAVSGLAIIVTSVAAAMLYLVLLENL